METLKLIPAPDTIPAPWQLFELLDLLLFVVHLLLMNLVLGGSLLRLFRGGQNGAESLTSVLTGKLPTTFALTVTIGVAPLLFIQVIYGHLFYTSSVLMAVWWILVIPTLILSYYGLYLHAKSSTAWKQIGLMISVLGLLYISFMFVNNMTLMLAPERWTSWFASRGGTLLNLGDAILWPRWLHMVTGSVAVAGLFTALLWHFRQKKSVTDASGKILNGMKIFGYATLVQIVIGVWYLLVLPNEVISRFMGGSLPATLLLAVGILLGVVLVFTALRHMVMLTTLLLLIQLVLMAGIRALQRSFTLEAFFNPADLTVSPQYPILTLFLVILLVGLGIIYWMLKVAKEASDNGSMQQEVTS